MALRSKFKSLLKLDTVKPLKGTDDFSSVAPTNVFYDQKAEDIREFEDDPTPDDEVIEGIENVYFSDLTFDPNQHELDRLSESLVIDDLDAYRNKLRRQLQAVSRQFSQKILEKQGAYVRELERVIDLQSSLQKATSVCSRGRRCLETAKQEASLGSLNVLAKHRRKVLLLDLLKSLRIIKTLQQTDIRLQELLEEDDYPRAIQLCLECQRAASTYKHFTCISELNSKLQETLDGIEEQLDVALSKLCNKFDAAQYDRIHSAYELLGKTQIAMDQLQMHYVNTVNTVALRVVSDYLKDPSFLSEPGQDLSFASLCKNIDPERFLPCLLALCKHFWEVMNSYQQTLKWHESLMERKKSSQTEEPTDNQTQDRAISPESERLSPPNSEISYMFDQQYVKSKLEQGLTRIWQDIQQKVKCYILSTDLAYFKYDDFISVLDVINRVIQVGEDFCGSRSQALQESVRVQTISYFTAYHRATLDELRMFLENEIWELCPVQAKFNILGLQEYHFLRPQANLVRGHRKTPSGTVKPETSSFASFVNKNSPFDNASAETTTASNSEEQLQSGAAKSNGLYYNDDHDDDDEDDEEPDELKMDFVDERTGEERKDSSQRGQAKQGARLSSKTPIITNTTLNVLRSFGKYMQMMTVLKPISFDVVICMSQLFDYYLYAVYTFFGSSESGSPGDWMQSSTGTLSNRMQTTLKRISNNIILKNMDGPELGELKVPAPSLSPMVNLRSEEQLFGLSHRVIAMESLVFLAKQLTFLHNHLDSYIPPQKRAFLSQFYAQTVDVTEELRIPVYRCVAEKAIDYGQTVQLMANVKWDVKEIMSQHSAYVDVLLLEFQSFSLRIAAISKVVPIPKDANHVLWSHVIQLANRSFVEGFSNVRRCSNEGRALMQLDYQQYLMKLEKFNPVKPIPGRDFVETYIKAFYLNEPDLERWIRDHVEYSTKQLHNLITCGVGSHISKKGKQKLLAWLDEIEKSRGK